MCARPFPDIPAVLLVLRHADQDAPVCPSAGRKWIGILTGFPDRDLLASMTGAIADAPGSNDFWLRHTDSYVAGRRQEFAVSLS